MKSPIVILHNFISPIKCYSDNIIDYIEVKSNEAIQSINNHYGVIVSDMKAPVIITNNIVPMFDRVKHAGDFTGYMALRDYNSSTPFDESTDVYGGELMFMNYRQKIFPEVGNLIIFPSSENFKYAHNPISAGELHYVKITFSCKEPYSFNRLNFSTELS